MFEIIGVTALALIALGPIWWIGLFVFFGFMIVLGEHEAPGFAIIAALFITGLLWLTSVANFPLWAWNNPGELLIKAFMWFVAGAIYAGYRFDRHGYDESLRYTRDKAERPGFFKDYVPNPAFLAEEAAAADEQRLINPKIDKTIYVDTAKPLIAKEGYIPKALDNKHKLTNWIVLWPFSLFWYVCSQGLKRVADFVIRHCQGIYNRLAARHFADLA